MRLIDRYEPDFGMTDHLNKAFIIETFRGDVSVVWTKLWALHSDGKNIQKSEGIVPQFLSGLQPSFATL